jgi:hypothetical protein
MSAGLLGLGDYGSDDSDDADVDAVQTNNNTQGANSEPAKAVENTSESTSHTAPDCLPTTSPTPNERPEELDAERHEASEEDSHSAVNKEVSVNSDDGASFAVLNSMLRPEPEEECKKELQVNTDTK